MPLEEMIDGSSQATGAWSQKQQRLLQEGEASSARHNRLQQALVWIRLPNFPASIATYIRCK
jgi:hypothetical protein